MSESIIHENGLFILRRDLRIVDNNGLNLLNTKCKKFIQFLFLRLNKLPIKININQKMPFNL